jgi:hypothetical protein
MNITLSASKELIEKSREFARKRNTTLNNLIRNFLISIGGEDDRDRIAEEFAELARNHAGKSAKDFKFNRDSVYDRGI